MSGLLGRSPDEPTGRANARSMINSAISGITRLPGLRYRLILTEDQRSRHPLSTNRPISGSSRRSSTNSEGRQSRTPFGVTTIGRLINMGWASMKPINSSSVHFASASPSSAYGVPFSRSRSRTEIFIAVISSISFSRVGGFFKYSMTVRRSAALPDHGKRVARRAAVRIVIDRDAQSSASGLSGNASREGCNNQVMTIRPATAPHSSATINPGRSTGRMPENVLVNDRAIATAGLANDVEAVNQ